MEDGSVAPFYPGGNLSSIYLSIYHCDVTIFTKGHLFDVSRTVVLLLEHITEKVHIVSIFSHWCASGESHSCGSTSNSKEISATSTMLCWFPAYTGVPRMSHYSMFPAAVVFPKDVYF